MWAVKILCLPSYAVVLFLQVLESKLVSSDPVLVSVPYGDSVTLPCDGRAAAQIPEDQLFIQWRTPDRAVLDIINGRLHPGPGFENRTEVSWEKVRQGDFSLSLLHTSFSDEDVYECFSADEANQMRFLGSWLLSVTGRQDARRVRSGADLDLPLLTRWPVQLQINDSLAFSQDRGWPALARQVSGLRGALPAALPVQERISLRDGALVLHSVTPADQGRYTLKELGSRRTVSVVEVTVEDSEPKTVVLSPAVIVLVLLLPLAAGVAALILWKRKHTPVFKHTPVYKHPLPQQV